MQNSEQDTVLKRGDKFEVLSLSLGTKEIEIKGIFDESAVVLDGCQRSKIPISVLQGLQKTN